MPETPNQNTHDERCVILREADIDEVLTMPEIEPRSAPNCVLIAEPQIDDKFDVTSCKVVFHSSDADRAYRKAHDLKFYLYLQMYYRL